MEFKSLILISFFIGFFRCQNFKYCKDVSPYIGDINLDEITGVWYGIKKIPQMQGEYKVAHTNKCFHIIIKEIYIQHNLSHDSKPGLAEQYSIRHFVLEWHEGLSQDDYHIKVNTSRKGFWTTEIPNGSVDKMNRSFGGIIQVLRMTSDSLVLKFCIRMPFSQRYSVILTRNGTQLTTVDPASIHNVFTSKNLPASTLELVCENSALTMNLSNVFLFLISAFNIFYL